MSSKGMLFSSLEAVFEWGSWIWMRKLYSNEEAVFEWGRGGGGEEEGEEEERVEEKEEEMPNRQEPIREAIQA